MEKYLSVLRSVFVLGVALLCSAGAYHLAVCQGNEARAQVALTASSVTERPIKCVIACGMNEDGLPQRIRVDHMGRVIVSPQSEERITRVMGQEFRVWAECQAEVEVEWR